MFGDTIFENPSEQYAEYLFADEKGIRVVCCVQRDALKLYRIEWMDTDGTPHNMAVYSILDAMSMFRIKQLNAIAEQQLEYESQESPESRRNGYGYEAQSN